MCVFSTPPSSVWSRWRIAWMSRGTGDPDRIARATASSGFGSAAATHTRTAITPRSDHLIAPSLPGCVISLQERKRQAGESAAKRGDGLGYNGTPACEGPGASMEKPASGDITGLLEQWRQGDQAVEARIVDAVYQELHQIARRYARMERAGHSLQATALVNEAYVRLVARRSSWKNRAHFFGVAATLMRRILIDHARRSRAGKRGDGVPHVPLEDDQLERMQTNLSSTDL